MVDMRHVTAAIGLVLLLLARPAAGDEPKGKAAPFNIHSGYFEKNNAGLKGESSYLALASQKKFDKIFGVAFIAGAKQRFLPKGAFETRLVAAVIKRGNAPWKYTVDKVTADKGTLYVNYQARAENPSGARFASPLILSVERAPYTQVVFIENGKKVGTAEFPKR
jgi:hypothetical protein